MTEGEEDAMDDATVDPAADLVVDGNALAGALMAAFGTEMTAVPSRCTHCGTVSVVAQLRAYVRGPGAVLRCPTCAGVVLRVVETADATYLDARGAAFIRIDRR
jgi:phage FluMu protein Com